MCVQRKEFFFFETESSEHEKSRLFSSEILSNQLLGSRQKSHLENGLNWLVNLEVFLNNRLLFHLEKPVDTALLCPTLLFFERYHCKQKEPY